MRGGRGRFSSSQISSSFDNGEKSHEVLNNNTLSSNQFSPTINSFNYYNTLFQPRSYNKPNFNSTPECDSKLYYMSSGLSQERYNNDSTIASLQSGNPSIYPLHYSSNSPSISNTLSTNNQSAFIIPDKRVRIPEVLNWCNPLPLSSPVNGNKFQYPNQLLGNYVNIPPSYRKDFHNPQPDGNHNGNSVVAVKTEPFLASDTLVKMNALPDVNNSHVVSRSPLFISIYP